MKEKHKNFTLSLPEPLLQKFRVYAATRNQSMTELMANAVARMMADDDEYDAAHRRLIERMRNSPSRGTGGVFKWTRDELHER